MAFGCLSVGIRIRAALTTAVARKCYGMAHLTPDTAAEAVGFVAKDINKIFEGVCEIHYLWCVCSGDVYNHGCFCLSGSFTCTLVFVHTAISVTATS